MEDLLKYPEGLEETIKYMGYLTGTDEEKKQYLMSFIITAVQN